MKKVGIITHYHNSLNYGGNLQAYALCKFLEQQGVDAEQISFAGSFTSKEVIKKRKLGGFLKAAIIKILGFPFRMNCARKIKKEDAICILFF